VITVMTYLRYRKLFRLYAVTPQRLVAAGTHCINSRTAASHGVAGTRASATPSAPASAAGSSPASCKPRAPLNLAQTRGRGKNNCRFRTRAEHAGASAGAAGVALPYSLSLHHLATTRATRRVNLSNCLPSIRTLAAGRLRTRATIHFRCYLPERSSPWRKGHAKEKTETLNRRLYCHCTPHAIACWHPPVTCNPAGKHHATTCDVACCPPAYLPAAGATSPQPPPIFSTCRRKNKGVAWAAAKAERNIP